MRQSNRRIAAQGGLLLAGACLQWCAMAQGIGTSVWRCGNTYTDQPCAAGKALEVEDTRSATQKSEADQTTRDVRAEAVRMERDRTRLAATQGPGQATLIDNAPRPRHAAPVRSEASLNRPRARRHQPRYLGAPAPGALRTPKGSRAPTL